MLLKKIFTDENLNKAWKKTGKCHKSCGIDGITAKDFEKNLEKNLQTLRREILCEIYVPAPLTGFHINKENGKKRFLSILCIRDHVAQHTVHMYLNSVFETVFSNNSFAFRPERSVDTAIERIIEISRNSFYWIIKADIASYFDTIDRFLLYKILYRYIQDKSLLRLISKWMEIGVIRNGKLIKEKLGIPQGSVISPILSNIYLHPFDELMISRGFNLVRYCDDFVILCKTQQDSTNVLNEVKKVLEHFKLNLKESSILITSIRDGFTFLGKKVSL